MLVIHLIVRWSDEGIDDDNRMAVNTRAAVRALDSVTPTIDAAMKRLVGRRLIVIERDGWRRLLRLSPLRYDVGRLWPERGDPDAVIVRRDVLKYVMAKASRSSDARQTPSSPLIDGAKSVDFLALSSPFSSRSSKSTPMTGSENVTTTVVNSDTGPAAGLTLITTGADVSGGPLRSFTSST